MKRVLWAALCAVVAVLLVCSATAQAAQLEGADSLVDSVGPLSGLELEELASTADDSALLEQAAELQAEAEVETEQEQEHIIEQEAEAGAEAEGEEELPAMLEMLVARGRSGKHSKKHHGVKHGWGISSNPRRRVQQRLPAARLTGAAATLTRANVRCVLCQFIAQKLKKGLTAAPPAAAGAAAPSLIESFSFASTAEQMRIQSAVSAAAEADAVASAIPPMFAAGKDAPRRFRHTDVLASRASRARFTQVRAGQPGSETDAARAAYLALYTSVYASFEGLCTQRMPLAYLPYCNDMLKSYRFFAQGLNYDDRADQICMNGNFCDSRAYVRRVTHNAYQREPGDA